MLSDAAPRRWYLATNTSGENKGDEMSADSLAVALMAIEDPDLRSRAANGDMSGFHPDVQLDAEEADLVRAAAAEEVDPEVAGFDASSSAFYHAASRVPGHLSSEPVQASFQSFMAGKFNIGAGMGGGCACPPMNSVGFAGFGMPG